MKLMIFGVLLVTYLVLEESFAVSTSTSKNNLVENGAKNTTNSTNWFNNNVLNPIVKPAVEFSAKAALAVHLFSLFSKALTGATNGLGNVIG